MTSLLPFLPWISVVGAVACAVMGTQARLRPHAGKACAASIFLTFLAALAVALPVLRGGPAAEALVFDWLSFGSFKVELAYQVDRLVAVMLLVVTGIGTLIATYAIGYMKGDASQGRFFSAMALFIFAMTTLVMGRNLPVVFLGWEGVGLCSYLLIGYYYGWDKAVAASQKAFIVNRIGDLGFLLGMFLVWKHFGTLEIGALTQAFGGKSGWEVQAIPFCFMLAAFGKSAQAPLYVWLPDAMAGPTPVSALVHAATMVTAGVFLVARLFPVFQAVSHALEVVAGVGAFTALFAATIALTCNDLKGVFAYSTVSQLGFMFIALGAGAKDAAVYHLVTHAFFKALLFLTAGSVMHALGGQLDIRKMAGMGKWLPVTKWLMLAGCLALAGFPFTAGFFSKDDILAAALHHDSRFIQAVGAVAVFTAFLTAFYTMRLWCTVFMGAPAYEMGADHHGEDSEEADGHGHAAEPHEMPLWPMNLPLVVLAVGALGLGGVLFLLHKPFGAFLGTATHHPHDVKLMVFSGVVALSGIGLAFITHGRGRTATAPTPAGLAPLVELLRNKWFVDEGYDRALVRPLWLLGQILFVVDMLVIDGTLRLLAKVPGGVIGRSARQGQHGSLQGHGLAMVTGVALTALFLILALLSK